MGKTKNAIGQGGLIKIHMHTLVQVSGSFRAESCDHLIWKVNPLVDITEPCQVVFARLLL